MKELPWKMPNWMKPFVGLIHNPAKRDIEDLINDDGTDRAAPEETLDRYAAKMQVMLLQTLYKHNVLKRSSKKAKFKEGDKEFMQLAGQAAHYRLPDNWGFILFAFPFGETGRARYCANAQREDAINLIKEWMKAQKSYEAWMKHVK